MQRPKNCPWHRAGAYTGMKTYRTPPVDCSGSLKNGALKMYPTMAHITKYLLVSLATLSLIACATPVRVLYDKEVDRLCAFDGGVKVFETVRLPATAFNLYGNLKHVKLLDGESALGPEYRYVRKREYLRGRPDSSTPALIRSEAAVYRRTDSRLLGTYTNYIRTGGEAGPFVVPSYDCPSASAPFFESIFTPIINTDGAK